MWSKLRRPKYDHFFWINAHAHPVISTYYPVAGVLSVVGDSFKNIDTAFLVFLVCLYSHVLLGFAGFFCLIQIWASPAVALFGAITFTLAGYNWKQQPCFQYTIAWFPWLLYGIATNNFIIAGASSGLLLLAGYYPIGIQCLAIAFMATVLWHTSLLWIPIGTLIGSIQIIPFIKYLPKTIRANAHDEIGKVPWWHFFSLITPRLFRRNINGVGYWEMSYYVGIIPLLVIWYTSSMAWILIVISVALMMGAFSKLLPRIPARWAYTFQFGLIWSALNGLQNLHVSNTAVFCICLIQAADLWLNNSPLLVNHPYAELYQKPTWAFNNRLTRYLKGVKGRVSGLPYPLFTGHINELRTLGYSGGMQLKLMSKWRGDKNPNGSGEHDFFKNNEDTDALDRYRVEYSYTTKKLNWQHTPLRNLWKNPRLSSV